MKKAFKFYLIAWAIMFVIFNIIVIALPKETTIGNITYTKFGGLSWITLILFELCFIAHLFFTATAIRQNKLSGTFYRLPLIRLSYACLIVTTVLGCIAMAVPNLPSWIPLAVVILILVIYAMSILKAEVAVNLVENIDNKVRTGTSFIRELTVDADTLVNRANGDKVKTTCKKVYEAIRYSDPMSSGELMDVEGRIGTAFAVFREAVVSDDENAAKASADELLALISERNQRCKSQK